MHDDVSPPSAWQLSAIVPDRAALTLSGSNHRTMQRSSLGGRRASIVSGVIELRHDVTQGVAFGRSTSGSSPLFIANRSCIARDRLKACSFRIRPVVVFINYGAVDSPCARKAIRCVDAHRRLVFASLAFRTSHATGVQKMSLLLI